MNTQTQKRYEPFFTALVSALVILYVILALTVHFAVPGMLAILIAVQQGLSIRVAHRDMKEKRIAKKPALMQMVVSYIAMTLCGVWAAVDIYVAVSSLYGA